VAETNAAKEARAEREAAEAAEQAAAQNDRTIEQESGEVVAVDDSGLPQPEDALAPGMVKVKLAHPIKREQDLIYLGLPVGEKYGVNDEITVTKDGAKSLINAGMVQVDPADRAEVDNVLGVAPKLD
jgi:hypothetical protein